MDNTIKAPKKRGPKPKTKADRITAYPLGLSGSQISFLERAAKKANLNVSEYLRGLINADIEAAAQAAKSAS